MSNSAKLKGKTFGKLVVIKRSDKRLGKQKRIAWECLCSCGRTTLVNTSDLKSGHTKSCGCGRSSIVADKKYGELTTIKPTKQRIAGHVVWECLCSCGKEHFVTAGNLKSGRVKSCGCLVSDRTNVKGKKFGRLTAKRRVTKKNDDRNYWECICDCGETTTVSTSNLNRGHIKSCGCYRIDLVTGENSRFYNPDLTNEERLANNRYVSSVENMHQWRKRVYERDDYTCVKCEVRGGDLNAHHMDGWHWCEDRRFDVSNGATLCVSCHKEFHLEYGNKNNTEEQFEEFAQMEVAK